MKSLKNSFYNLARDGHSKASALIRNNERVYFGLTYRIKYNDLHRCYITLINLEAGKVGIYWIL